MNLGSNVGAQSSRPLWRFGEQQDLGRANFTSPTRVLEVGPA